MAKTKRNTTVTSYRRIRGRLRKFSQRKKTESSRVPGRLSDNQIIAQETDSGARERMFAEKQKQATKRSAHRNLTTQVTTTGANIASGVATTQGLNQNIQGGASSSKTYRDEDDSGRDEDYDAYPPAY